MKFSENGVFRCFLCFDSFMGYIERGIDYIQLKCVKGKIYLRSIEVSSTPLKVKCAEIEIGFTADGNRAILDNDCEIAPGRDLLVIIPVEDNN